MDESRKIAIPLALKQYVFFVACAALPWINRSQAGTLLLILSGVLILISKEFSVRSLRDVLAPFTLLFVAFYALQLIALALFPADHYNQLSVEQKASLVFIPVLLALVFRYLPQGWEFGGKGFIAGSFLAMLFCFVSAVFNYSSTHNSTVFFYHEYAKPIRQNAIYTSANVFVALCLLIWYSDKKPFRLQNWQTLALVFFLFLNLLLLSSKMVIVTGSLLLVFLLFRKLQSPKIRLAGTAFFSVSLLALVFINNPIRDRFAEVNLHKYTRVFQTTDFSNYYFNGLDLRLLLSKMGLEVISEKNNWLFGESGRRYHHALNQKILDRKLFTGDGKTDEGFLNFNLHNQYTENFVQFGVTGLLLLLSILAYSLYIAIKQRNLLLGIITTFFIAAFFSESFLETQAGILLFTLLLIGEWNQSRKLV